MSQHLRYESTVVCLLLPFPKMIYEVFYQFSLSFLLCFLMQGVVSDVIDCTFLNFQLVLRH